MAEAEWEDRPKVIKKNQQKDRNLFADKIESLFLWIMRVSKIPEHLFFLKTIPLKGEFRRVNGRLLQSK